MQYATTAQAKIIHLKHFQILIFFVWLSYGLHLAQSEKTPKVKSQPIWHPMCSKLKNKVFEGIFHNLHQGTAGLSESEANNKAAGVSIYFLNSLWPGHV